MGHELSRQGSGYIGGNVGVGRSVCGQGLGSGILLIWIGKIYEYTLGFSTSRSEEFVLLQWVPSGVC